uniref:CBM1 domain-containing protein n=1 Tax=Globisporangium ultimum (strain ATCC 200006 / CBS 805.95 / DAOM BR144) TaxID=431595 RepID=K3WJF7_GLOUD
MALTALLYKNFVAVDLVSVEGDGTFGITGPVCSGPGTISTPLGSACPQIGDTVVDECHPYNPSYDTKSGKCVAPVPAVCKPVKGGVWGCVWDLSGLAPADDVTTVPVAGNCQDVSVEGDGTFCIEGLICSGSGAEPTGSTCPQVGDTVVGDCYPYLPSYDVKTGK